MATANGFASDASFTLLKLIHSNIACLCSSNANKYEITDLNRVPYAVRFNRELANVFVVADENGFVKLFRTYPNLRPVKEFHVNKSCIYDVQWLNAHQLACGGGDKHVSVFDLNVGEQIAVLKGHTESVKSISQAPENPFVLASGARDGAVLIYDLRCNRSPAVAAIAATTTAEAEQPPALSAIKPVNNIAKAHFDATAPPPLSVSTRLGKSGGVHASPSSAAQLHSQRRASPIASVAYQSESLLISAGATDGLIKAWDTRKIYTPAQVASGAASRRTHAHWEPIPPVYTFSAPASSSSASSSEATPSSRVASKLSFSNVLFNHARTRLYANCMNNSIYEYNFCTYKARHTRVLNSPAEEAADKPAGKKLVKPHHLNQSNFIKSSLSMCDNFLLTGSSDSNAYIYATHVNGNLRRFRQHMPVLVLRGHNNEVTAVDWSPVDIDQLVTCSDDNVVRLWSCRRDLETSEEKLKECMFLQAEVCFDKYDADPEAPMTEAQEAAATGGNESSRPACPRSYDDDGHFVPSLSALNTPRFNNHFPHLFQLCDEFFFKNYDYKNFVCAARQRLPKPSVEQSTCPADEGLEQADDRPGSQTTKKFTILKNLAHAPLADLPINIIEPHLAPRSMESSSEAPTKPKLAWPLGLLSSASVAAKTVKNSDAKPPKPLSISRKTRTAVEEAAAPEAGVNSPRTARRQPRARLGDQQDSIKKSASKKRSAAAATPSSFMNMSDLKKPLSQIENAVAASDDGARLSSPKSKKRLIMSTEAQLDAENSNDALGPSSSKPSTPRRAPRAVLQAKAANTLSSSPSTSRTPSSKNSILNYFSKNVV